MERLPVGAALLGFTQNLSQNNASKISICRVFSSLCETLSFFRPSLYAFSRVLAALMRPQICHLANRLNPPPSPLHQIRLPRIIPPCQRQAPFSTCCPRDMKSYKQRREK